MNVLFVNYSHLDSNSGIHIFNLANQLAGLGVKCTVCVPAQKHGVASVRTSHFQVVTPNDLHAAGSNRKVDLIHAWTPRENVRKITAELRSTYACPYVVHLEDNEQALVEAETGLPLRLLERVPTFVLDRLVRGGMVHPRRYGQFLVKANGATLIVESLRRFCPPGLPAETLWAGYQEDLPWDMPRDVAYRRSLGIADAEYLVAYTGNAHAANWREVATLYRAVEGMHRRGFPVKLVRTGRDYVRVLDPFSSAYKKHYCIELGRVARTTLPTVLSIADVLVQPGSAGPFNDFRFPSKLPEYLASGKPVLLANANIAAYLKDEDQCLLLNAGDATDISDKLRRLFTDESLRERIGRGGQRFAEQHLRWSTIALKLQAFYLRVLGQP